MGRGGGYILEPGITLQADVPLANLLALIEKALGMTANVAPARLAARHSLTRIIHGQTLAQSASEGTARSNPRSRVGLVWRTLPECPKAQVIRIHGAARSSGPSSSMRGLASPLATRTSSKLAKVSRTETPIPRSLRPANEGLLVWRPIGLPSRKS